MTGPGAATERWVIGSAPSCAMVLPDEYASLMHCVVSRARGVCFVADLGSTNGTWLRRGGTFEWVKVAGPVQIRPGDAIKVGRTVIPWSIR